MSARAVAVIRPAANIIARLTFLYILSGQGQLHAYRDSSILGETRLKLSKSPFLRNYSKPANDSEELHPVFMKVSNGEQHACILLGSSLSLTYSTKFSGRTMVYLFVPQSSQSGSLDMLEQNSQPIRP
jgi:hypothetical protein